MTRLKLFILGVLLKLVFRLQRETRETDYKTRLDVVRSFFHSTLPGIMDGWENKAIIEGGTFNYFELPSGNLPKFEFVIPEIPLYVVVPGILSASWPEARDRGVSREEWEVFQCDLAAIEKYTQEVATIGLAAKPKLMVIRWDDPINHLTLADRLEELIK